MLSFLANCNNFNRTLYTFDLYSGGTIFIDFKILINNILDITILFYSF